MTKIQKITLSPSRDIPFNKLVLAQSNVRRTKAGISIEDLAEDIARRSLLQSLNVRPIYDAEGQETGMFEVPAGGRRYRALELLVKQKRLAKIKEAKARLDSAQVLAEKLAAELQVERKRRAGVENELARLRDREGQGALSDAEAALKAFQSAKDKEARRKAVEELERTVNRLKESVK